MSLANAVAAAETAGIKLGEALRPATVTYGNATVPCACGVFELQQVFVGQGFSASLRAPVLIRKAELPNVKFHSDQELTVTQEGSEPRRCKISSHNELLTAWQLIVEDVNEGA